MLHVTPNCSAVAALSLSLSLGSLPFCPLKETTSLRNHAAAHAISVPQQISDLRWHMVNASSFQQQDGSPRIGRSTPNELWPNPWSMCPGFDSVNVAWKVAWSVNVILYETDLSFHHIHDISLKNLLRIDLDLFHISTSSAACAQSVRPLSL